MFINNSFIKGTYEFNNSRHGNNRGDVYIGEFYNNPKDLSELKLHGKGIYYFLNNNDVYDGEFDNGKKSGFGTYFFNGGQFAGTIYIGDFKDEKFHGYGTYYFGNDLGRIYMGQFSNGKANGSGLLIESNGKIWSENLKTGIG